MTFLCFLSLVSYGTQLELYITLILANETPCLWILPTKQILQAQRERDDNGGWKCDANTAVPWREKLRLSWLLLTAHDNTWWITHAGLSKRTRVGPTRQSETEEIFWVSWRDKNLKHQRSKSRCSNAVMPRQSTRPGHMRKTLRPMCRIQLAPAHTSQRNMWKENALLHRKHNPAQFNCSIISVNIATNLIFLHLNLLANIFDRTSQGEWVHESHDQKHTAHLRVLSRPALHLVKACLSKPIWANHCAPREDKQGPHAFIYENTWQRQLSFVKEKKKEIRSQVHLSHVTFLMCSSLLWWVTSLLVENNRMLCVQEWCARTETTTETTWLLYLRWLFTISAWLTVYIIITSHDLLGKIKPAQR